MIVVKDYKYSVQQATIYRGIAQPVAPVNGQDERAAVDSPTRFSKWVIKGATAKSAVAPLPMLIRKIEFD